MAKENMARIWWKNRQRKKWPTAEESQAKEKKAKEKWPRKKGQRKKGQGNYGQEKLGQGKIGQGKLGQEKRPDNLECPYDTHEQLPRFVLKVST